MAQSHNHDEWRKAIVLENKQIARGSFWLKIKSLDEDEIVYQPGHVLALGFIDAEGNVQRKAYTVSKANIQEKTIEHLYRFIPAGKFSPRLVNLVPGAYINFRGVHHNPIHLEISENATSIIGISTGTGVGPLFGFANKVLSENLIKIPLTVYTGYRYLQDECLRAELNKLQNEYENFKWYSTFTKADDSWNGFRGRVTEVIPPLINDFENTHFHLVGNGQMVSEFIDALKEIGVPHYRITKETYFNHGAKSDHQTVKEITNRFKTVKI